MEEISLKCKGCDYTPDYTEELINCCKNQGKDNANHILEMHLPKFDGLSFKDFSSNLNETSNPYSVFKRFFLY